MLMLKTLKVYFSIFFLLINGISYGFLNKVQAQEDTTYYINYKKLLTTRTYVSRKYTSLFIRDINDQSRIVLQPTSTLNLGIGATYNDFTLNLAYGFEFMNANRNQVDTRYLDLQAHIYPKNWVIDLFGQFYDGFYLQSYTGPLPDIPPNLAFPNLEVRKFGTNVQYLFNGEKLSLKAAFLQSAWQKKSAGSFVTGFEFYFGNAKDDENILSEFIPDPIEFKKMNFVEFGPNVGYVHTFVFAKHFFITGMVSGNIGLGNTTISSDTEKEGKWGVNSNYFLRGFVGYNGPIWSINANYVHNNVRIKDARSFSTDFQTGNYRINFVYRFNVGPKLKPYLEYIDLERYLPEMFKQKNDN